MHLEFSSCLTNKAYDGSSLLILPRGHMSRTHSIPMFNFFPTKHRVVLVDIISACASCDIILLLKIYNICQCDIFIYKGELWSRTDKHTLFLSRLDLLDIKLQLVYMTYMIIKVWSMYAIGESYSYY